MIRNLGVTKQQLPRNVCASGTHEKPSEKPPTLSNTVVLPPLSLTCSGAYRQQ